MVNIDYKVFTYCCKGWGQGLFKAYCYPALSTTSFHCAPRTPNYAQVSSWWFEVRIQNFV